MSQIPSIVSIASIKKQLRAIKALAKVLAQYAKTTIADHDICVLLEDIHDDIAALNLDDMMTVYDGFASAKANFMVLAYYEPETIDRDFSDSMFSLSEKFEAVNTAISDRVDFECAVNRLQAVGVSYE